MDHKSEELLSGLTDAVRSVVSARLWFGILGMAVVLLTGVAGVVSFIVNQANSGLKQAIDGNRTAILRELDQMAEKVLVNSNNVSEPIAHLDTTNASLRSLSESIDMLSANITVTGKNVSDLESRWNLRSIIGIVGLLQELRIFNSYVNELTRLDEQKTFTTHFAGSHFYTVFAPSDAAIEALPFELIQRFENAEVHEDNRRLLEKFVLSHFVPGHFQMSDFIGRNLELSTLGGASLLIEGESSQWKVNGGSVLRSDLPAADGLVHVIDVAVTP